MALELVTVRARTRGKSPQLFSYQGVGKLTPRDVQGKDGEPVKNEAGENIQVDDIDVTGVINVEADGLQSLIDLYGSHPIEGDTRSAMQRIADGALVAFNLEQRHDASPVTEVVTEDELTPIINAMVEAGILKTENVGVLRRTVTTGAKAIEMSRLDYVKLMKEYKALAKAGKVPA